MSKPSRYLRENAKIAARMEVGRHPPGTKCEECGSPIRGRPPNRCRSWHHIAIYFARHLAESF